MNRLKSVWLVVAVSLVVPAIAQTSVSDKATTGAPAATSKSPTCGRVKIPHLAVTGRGMITRFDAPWQGVQRTP